MPENSTSSTPGDAPHSGPLWVEGAIPAATVILVRDGDAGIETLMLRRDGKLSFAAGMWVFPGGRIDPQDEQFSSKGGQAADEAHSREQRLESASRRAAVREAYEESGLVLEPSALHRWSHWTAPEQAAPRRFTTAFYIAAIDVSDEDVVIDDGEIRAFMWRSPSELISERDGGTVGLTPPTFITLHQLSGYTSVEDLLGGLAIRSVEHFATRFEFLEETPVAMYHGDAGYHSGDVTANGARHRLVMDTVWHYLRDT